ncbi:TIGR04086 family membrane protein [Serratia oryzae]|uniref:Uncharacterized protein n=1 Tax=Serratia oryzae TaxID=2034155 RepID=A0A1S8CLJ1_9GAMM|nr:TIGR04086 family membrane protein [Serratia oryzae]OMQ24732.1 hypothetical protein BMI79_07880 [Serratia oryzae]
MTLLILIILSIAAVYLCKKYNKSILKVILKAIAYYLVLSLPLASIIVGVFNFSDISSEGVNFITASLYFLSSMLLILSGFYVIIFVIFKNKIKKLSSSHKKLNYINGYTTSILFFTLFFSGGLLFIRTETMQGESLGFPPSMDFSEAKRHNIYNVDEYSKFLAEKKAKEKAEQDRIAAEQVERDSEITLVSKHYSDSDPKYDIVAKFDKRNSFEMSILENIQSYPNGSFERYRAALIYRDYGIDLKDFERMVLPRCSRSMEALKSGYESVTRSWLPYSTYKDKGLLREEVKRRDNYNKSFSESIRIESQKQNECFYSLSQEQPNHSLRDRPEDLQ